MTRNQRIKFCLQEAGISQEQLAKVLGISQAGVGKQLNKKDEIDSWAFMTAVSNLTGRSLHWIITGEETERVEPPETKDVEEYERLIRHKIDQLALNLSEPQELYSDLKMQLIACQQKLIKCQEERLKLEKEMQELKNFSSGAGATPKLKTPKA